MGLYNISSITESVSTTVLNNIPTKVFDESMSVSSMGTMMIAEAAYNEVIVSGYIDSTFTESTEMILSEGEKIDAVKTKIVNFFKMIRDMIKKAWSKIRGFFENIIAKVKKEEKSQEDNDKPIDVKRLAMKTAEDMKKTEARADEAIKKADNATAKKEEPVKKVRPLTASEIEKKFNEEVKELVFKNYKDIPNFKLYVNFAEGRTYINSAIAIDSARSLRSNKPQDADDVRIKDIKDNASDMQTDINEYIKATVHGNSTDSKKFKDSLLASNTPWTETNKLQSFIQVKDIDFNTAIAMSSVYYEDGGSQMKEFYKNTQKTLNDMLKILDNDEKQLLSSASDIDTAIISSVFKKINTIVNNIIMFNNAINTQMVNLIILDKRQANSVKQWIKKESNKIMKNIKGETIEESFDFGLL